MQLVAYGAQDVYLTGNPQITFFRSVHKRHTNFSCECIEQTFSGTPNFGKNNVRVSISRNGDLVSRMYLLATISATVSSSSIKWAWIRNIGNSMIDNVEINIGGQKIDKHYGEWLNIWHELSTADDHSDTYDTLVGNTSAATKLSGATGSSGDKSTTVFVPLQFWFNRNVGLALPLIALQYHEVTVDFTFIPGSKTFNIDTGDWSSGSSATVTPNIDSAKLLVDYIYLDTEERKRFAQNSHEYLIEQVQDKSGGYSSGEPITAGVTSHSIDLHFNHPVKSIYWAINQNKLDFLGNDRESCTKNFIVRYCLQGLASQNIIRGTRITFGLDNSNTILLVINSTDSSFANSSSFTDNAVIPTSNILNSNATYYNDLIRVISSASVTFNSQSETEPVLNNVLWNSILVPELLPAAVCALDVSSSGIEETGALPENIFTAVTAASTEGSTVRLNQHNNFGTGIDGSGQTISTGLLKLNGNDRFTKREAVYFNKVVPWQSHMNNPPDGIYAYSFALNPEDHQPSGTCNFSRIDNSQLKLEFSGALASKLKVYAINYNVLRIMSGMGGLAYSN